MQEANKKKAIDKNRVRIEKTAEIFGDWRVLWRCGGKSNEMKTFGREM